MSGLKVDIDVTGKRGVLNTTINADILEEFKRQCKINGIRMNTLIEAFMRQYNEGLFDITLARK